MSGTKTTGSTARDKSNKDRGRPYTLKGKVRGKPTYTTKGKVEKGKEAAPKSSTFGDQLLASIAELSTPEAIEAAITGKAPPGAAFTVTRVPVLTGPAVAELRKQFGMSQSAFAAFLFVSVQTVQAWEQGRTPVQGSALRLLVWLRDDPGYFKAKLAAV